ncbi:MAG: hypothetical protein OXQ84_04900 [bacterium]|nr:hypothetical protein [bacterium]
MVAPVVSAFSQDLHASNGVAIVTRVQDAVFEGKRLVECNLDMVNQRDYEDVLSKHAEAVAGVTPA